MWKIKYIGDKYEAGDGDKDTSDIRHQTKLQDEISDRKDIMRVET